MDNSFKYNPLLNFIIKCIIFILIICNFGILLIIVNNILILIVNILKGYFLKFNLIRKLKGFKVFREYKRLKEKDPKNPNPNIIVSSDDEKKKEDALKLKERILKYQRDLENEDLVIRANNARNLERDRNDELTSFRLKRS
jgi:hypothetical protein